MLSLLSYTSQTTLLAKGAWELLDSLEHGGRWRHLLKLCSATLFCDGDGRSVCHARRARIHARECRQAQGAVRSLRPPASCFLDSSLAPYAIHADTAARPTGGV